MVIGCLVYRFTNRKSRHGKTTLINGRVTVIPNWLTNIMQFETSVLKTHRQEKEPLSSSPKQLQ
jgi:hypothetical protein